MKTQTRIDSAQTSYESPMVRDVEMRVHGVLCNSPMGDTETTEEEDMLD